MLIPHDELVALLNGYICENQLILSQHTFIASEKHKGLKDCLRQLEGVKSQGNSIIGDLTSDALISDKRVIGLRRELSETLTNLEEYLYSTFKQASDIAFDYALKFFRHRSDVLPRACVKVIAGDRIISLFRRPSFFTQSSEITISDSTAFERIASGAKHFLCNNIPKSIKEGKYQNVRIIKEKALNYREKTNASEADFDDFDEDWARCWKDSPSGEGIKAYHSKDSFYKSALVIPMTLTTDKLDDAFISHFRISRESKKAIFGFLCFDHREADFFDEAIDPGFCFVLADILSLYLIQQLTYTQYSSAYFQASLLTESE